MICAERNGIQALRLPEERQSTLCLAEGGERRGRVYKDRPARSSAGVHLAEQLRAPAEHRIKFLRIGALAVKAHQLAAKGERGAPVAGLLRFGERGKGICAPRRPSRRGPCSRPLPRLYVSIVSFIRRLYLEFPAVAGIIRMFIISRKEVSTYEKKTVMRSYAKLIVRVGANVQKGPGGARFRVSRPAGVAASGHAARTVLSRRSSVLLPHPEAAEHQKPARLDGQRQVGDCVLFLFRICKIQVSDCKDFHCRPPFGRESPASALARDRRT